MDSNQLPQGSSQDKDIDKKKEGSDVLVESARLFVDASTRNLRALRALQLEVKMDHLARRELLLGEVTEEDKAIIDGRSTPPWARASGSSQTVPSRRGDLPSEREKEETKEEALGARKKVAPVKEKEETTEGAAEGKQEKRVRTPPFVQKLFGARKKVVPEKEETTEGAAEGVQAKRVGTPPSLQGLGERKKAVPEKEKKKGETAVVSNEQVFMKIVKVKTDHGYKSTLMKVEKKEEGVAEADTEEGVVGTREKEEERVVEGLQKGETQGTNMENKSAKHEDED